MLQLRMSNGPELQRLRYLHAMGVVSYVSRRSLPGAAATQKLALRHARPAAAEQARLQSPKTPQSPEALRSPQAPPAARSGGLLSETFGKTRVDGPGAAVATGAGARQSAEARQGAAAIRFRLASVVFAGRLWIEDLGDGALATEQLQLIGAIARALVHPEVPQGAPRVAQFDWPMHQNQQLDLGADEASASLHGFLLRQLDEYGCVELMCFGEAAQQRLAGMRMSCALRKLPATQTLLGQPQLKRQLWQTLRS